MSSASKRFTRSVAEKQKNRIFRTVIDPHEEKVQICPIFKARWINDLKLWQDGWVKNENEKYIQIQLFLSASDSYLTCGRWLSDSFGFKKPTYVDLHYKGLDNHFDMTVVESLDQDVICISSDYSINNATDEHEDSDAKSVGNENEDNESDIQGFRSGSFHNNGLLGWELAVTKSVASVQKMQVGRIPREIANGVLHDREMILMQTPYTNDLINCEIKTSKRSKEWTKKEKYFTDGWYQFVRNYRPNVGDSVRFQLSNPPEVVYVEIIRPE